MRDEFEALIRRGAEVRGLSLSAAVVDRLAGYLDILAFWNRRINLTAFDLARPSEAAIARLVLEPAEASVFVRPVDRYGIDIGSGGGSPAIPLMICSPSLALTMVEVRVRKAAFLREVVRRLELPGTVQQARAEDLVVQQRVQLVTMRAVRPTEGIWTTIERALAEDGRLLWFGAPPDAMATRSALRLLEAHDAVTIFGRA